MSDKAQKSPAESRKEKPDGYFRRLDYMVMLVIACLFLLKLVAVLSRH